jgi:tripartite-type tricarboxylate transporter receptor subunit TctC
MKKILSTFLLCLSSLAYSAQPITIVVPVAPGGAIDLTARTLSKILTENDIENIVVNYPGANGDIALDHVLKEKNNVILAGAVATFVFSSVVEKRNNPYVGTMTFFSPVVKTATGFIANPNGYATFKSMIASAKVEPLPCGVSNAHGTAELNRINNDYGTKFEPVPYKGSGPLAVDLGGDNLKCAYDSIGSHIQRHDNGMLRILSTTHATTGLNVPLVSSVLPNYTFDNWYGFAIPNGGNVLENKKVINIMNNFSSYTNEVTPLVQSGFILEKTNKNIGQIIEAQTKYYQK